MTSRSRSWLFGIGLAGLLACYLWGLLGLPAFGRYPGPYGDLINAVAVAQTQATGVVSAVNFDYRGFDTLGEEFILFAAATGVATVLRHLRAEREEEPAHQVMAGQREPGTSEAMRMVTLGFIGPTAVTGWYLVTHAQTSPAGGFQGGVVLATAAVLLYLSGEFLVFKRLSPVAVTDAVGAVGAGGFAAVGLAGLAVGAAYLANVLPLGSSPGSVTSSGTIVVISFFVGIEVGAAFLLIVSELLEQTLLLREGQHGAAR
jgi:multicomponent Na+:H+ antiporter subunit B